MKEKIKNLLFYGGLTKEEYHTIRPQISEENRKSLIVFSILGVLGFGGGLTACILIGIKPFIIIYSISLFLMALFLILETTVAKKYPIISHIGAYVHIAIVLGVGISVGAMQPTERTTLLLPFYIFSAGMFCVRPILQMFLFFVTEIVYIAIMSNIQAPEAFRMNLINTLIFCVLGALTGIYFVSIKYGKHHTDNINKHLIETDQLTGLRNRRSYERELMLIKLEKRPVTIWVFDINGLKHANDSLGHDAGDELIIGAAQCIKDTFGSYGRSFRIGGDEFTVISNNSPEDQDELIRKFKIAQSSWHGSKVNELSVSLGVASIEDNYEEMLDNTIKKADAMMYENKNKYYMETGKDRRV